MKYALIEAKRQYALCPCPARRANDAVCLGLIEDNEEGAHCYMADVAELSDTKAEYSGLDMQQYRDAIGSDADNHSASSSTGGNYGPANPWDAPGMSVSDFI